MRVYFIFCSLFVFVACHLNQRYVIEDSAMNPIIDPGDHIIVDTSDRLFTYGDIVRCRYVSSGHAPDGSETELASYVDIFRIVGLPGDSIAVKDNICIINGLKRARFIEKSFRSYKFEEEFPNGIKIFIRHYPLEGVNNDQTTIKIPLGHYYVMSDDRVASYDSRYFGPIPKNYILGKIVKVVKQ